MVDSLIERLEANASRHSKKDAFTYLGSGANGGVVENQYTYEVIAQETDDMALNLLASGLNKGDLALLVFPPSIDFILAFIACLKAGIVAVPVFPPHPARRDTLAMFTKIVQACDATFALTSKSYSHMKKLSSLKDAFTSRIASSSPEAPSWPDNLTWIVTDNLHKTAPPKKEANQPLLQARPSDLAFLQFTSGSTSLPKGVMITHGNLADNLVKITTELAADNNTIVVSWLPQYHDMGLIGSYLGILYCGGSGYYMSPLTYLKRPAMWIEAISRFRGTHLQSPNFAFKLTARKFNKSNYPTNELDLTCVKHIINAAEPVTEDSIDAFCDAFCPYGLDRNVIYPTYGLAEHTVFVCSGGTQRLTVSKRALEIDGTVEIVRDAAANDSGDNDVTSRLIGCGYPAKQYVDVQIVSTATFQALGQDQVGEIWVSSDSKAAGYYNKPFETKRDFCAVIGVDSDNVESKGDDDDDIDASEEYLRTGDLGFMHNNELFICGRIKDLIIVGGRNYYPQDIESTAEASDGRIRPGCSAAFTVDPISGNDEEVALVLELRDVPNGKDLESECTQLIESLRALINREHSLSLTHVVLLNPRTVPKTTSGKISRSSCRKAFLQETLSIIYRKDFINVQTTFRTAPGGTTSPIPPGPIDPRTIRGLDKQEIMKRLKKDIGSIVNMPPSSLPVDTDLATMMDSLTLSQFKGRLEGVYATELSDEYLFLEGTNIKKLVEVVKLGYAPDDDMERDPGVPNNPSSGSASTQGPKSLADKMGCPPGFFCIIQ